MGAGELGEDGERKKDIYFIMIAVWDNFGVRGGLNRASGGKGGGGSEKGAQCFYMEAEE